MSGLYNILQLSKTYRHFLIGLTIPFLLVTFCLYDIFVGNSNLEIPVKGILLTAYIMNFSGLYLGFRIKNVTFFTSLALAFWLSIGCTILYIVLAFFLIGTFFHIPTS